MSLKHEITSSLKPGDDFYHYVNQRWLKAHPIPADKASFGVFEVMTDTNLDKLRRLLETKINAKEPLTTRLVKQYYQSAMDEAAIAKMTPAFVKAILDEVAALNDRVAIGQYLASQDAKGQGILWDLIIEPDDKDSKHYLTRFWQGGLGLPERTYYLEDGERFEQIRRQYRQYLADFFKLAGLDQPASRAKHVYELEVALAKASLAAADCRDPERVYNLSTPAQLAKRYPALDWDDYIKTIGLGSAKQVNIAQPDFVAAVNRLLTEQPIEHWRDYLVIHSLQPVAAKLSKPYEELIFGFYGKVLSGREELEPRWLRVARQCMVVLPEPTGRLFVEHYFDETAKAAIKDLVSHLRKALGARLGRLDWMADETKRQAQHKLSTFLPLLGYPDHWKSYDGLEFSNNHAGNYLAACRFDWRDHASRIEDSVDRTEWLMSPALVNAYYWPNTNGITFPAGILQPPFFDATGDFAANYGAIGAVIGHELTHGFDDQGSKYDADGNLVTWWQPADRTAFDARAQQLAKQYSRYKIADRHLDGQLTLGENIADLGGLLVAYDALQQALAESGQRQKIDGFTPEQRFFISYARTWCRYTRDEFLLQRIVADPHSPELFRVNGVVPNMDAFYDAFAVKPGEKLYLPPAKRVRIW